MTETVVTITDDETNEASQTVTYEPSEIVYQCQVHIELKHPISWGSQRRYHHHILIENQHCVSRVLDELIISYHDDGEPMEKHIPHDNVVEHTIRYLRSRNESEPQ